MTAVIREQTPFAARHLYKAVMRFSRPQKHAVMLLVDILVAPVAFLITLMITENVLWPQSAILNNILVFPTLAICAGLWSEALGIPRIKLNAYETTAVLRSALLAAILSVCLHLFSEFVSGSLRGATAVLYGLVFFALSLAIRYAMLRLLLWAHRQGMTRAKVLIYGAGATGMQLEAALRSHESIEPVAFIDDSPALIHRTVAGLPVLPPTRITEIAAEKGARRVLLAMPALSPPKQAQIARRLEGQGFEVQVLPSFAQLVGAEALVDKLTTIDPGSLLGRDRLDVEIASGCEAYQGRVILVSGAGGSIGSELCRQLLACRPAKVVLFELAEFALYTVEMELRGLLRDVRTEIVPVLGSVADARRVHAVIEAHRVEIVFHAAAYKHVPLVEANPIAGLENNVTGTRVLAETASAAGVERFILISSDKAVRPANVMGASKRLAEMVVQDMARRSDRTVFSMVRFGNVLGSSGSVVPLFQEQIARGGPVTLTHADVTRYFMTIGEAVRLVLLAGSYASEEGQRARGGDVFVLDMGRPMRIRDLACQMIEAHGYTVRDATNPDGDIEIVTTGLRPGEKLFEELLIGSDMLPTPHPKILRAREELLSELEFAAAMRDLTTAIASGDQQAARGVVSRWVDGYGAPPNSVLAEGDGAAAR